MDPFFKGALYVLTVTGIVVLIFGFGIAIRNASREPLAPDVYVTEVTTNRTDLQCFLGPGFGLYC